MMNKVKSVFCGIVLGVTVTGSVCCFGAEEDTAQEVSTEQTAPVQEVGKYGMLPVYGRDIKDGTYEIEAESSSSMFRIVQAELTVKDGQMEAAITLGGTGYLKLFMGTGEEALEADEKDCIGFTENEDGSYTYTIPVEALDKGLDCAAYSKRKERWYDRVILFEASSLPEEALLVDLPDYDLIEKAVDAYESSEMQNEENSLDAAETDEQEEQLEPEELREADIPFEPAVFDMENGEYSIEVSMSGGSGKASVNSPALLTVEDGVGYARLQWSSSSYDYMIVGGEKYLNENADGGYSVFTIPIAALDEEFSVIADTTAMEEAHEVEYTLTFYEESIGSKSQMPQEAAKRVVVIAMVIIIGGGILNHILNKKKRV